MTEMSGINERRLVELCGEVTAPDRAALDEAWARLDSLTKPPRSLGRLEEMAARLALVQQTSRPSALPAAIVLMAGDHGVVAEGVSAWPAEVTWQMVANFAAGGAAINQLARNAGAELVLVDVGVATDTAMLDGVVQAKVRRGTRNLAKEPAMTREEASSAFLVGADLARQLAGRGVLVIGTGEMGIGNTTPASALVAAYAGVEAADVVGRGTGIDDAALLRKTDVVEEALRLHAPSAMDPLGTLSALGGLEIAGMAGVMVGGAASGACVVCDGFISTAAALAAVRLCPACRDYLLPSHMSQEPGHKIALGELAMEPFVDLDMRLGEGTGAALGIGLLRAACEMMNGMATFAEAGVSEKEDA